MKFLFSLILTLPLAAVAQTSDSYINFVRQKQQGTTVVWDMPVAAQGAAASALTIEKDGSLFQLWTINQTKALDHLLDQKLVGAYLPKADIKITSLDPYSKVIRTRIDQAFNVEINITDLLTGDTLPKSATSVLLERHLGSYTVKSKALDATTVLANTPYSSAYSNLLAR